MYDIQGWLQNALQVKKWICHVSVNGTELLLCLVMAFMLGDRVRNYGSAPECQHGWCWELAQPQPEGICYLQTPWPTLCHGQYEEMTEPEFTLGTDPEGYTRDMVELWGWLCTNLTYFRHFFHHFSEGRKCATATHIFSVCAKDHTQFKIYAMWMQNKGMTILSC
jgi:hypothetical protein